MRVGYLRQEPDLVEEMEFFARLEANGLAGSNHHFGSSPRVATDASLAWLDGEDSEAAKLNAVTGDEGLLHTLEDGIDGGFSFGSGETGTFNNPLYQILLNHLEPPILEAVILCN